MFIDAPVLGDLDQNQVIYQVSVKQDISGCISTRKADTAYVFANPTVAIEGDALLCNNDTVLLIANINDINAGMGTFNYQWRICRQLHAN